MSPRIEKQAATITVGDLKQALEQLDERLEVRIQNGQLDPVPVRGVTGAVGNNGRLMALIVPNV
jgi:translation initiation factor 6 (eIF-6)